MFLLHLMKKEKEKINADEEQELCWHIVNLQVYNMVIDMLPGQEITTKFNLNPFVT